MKYTVFTVQFRIVAMEKIIVPMLKYKEVSDEMD